MNQANPLAEMAASIDAGSRSLRIDHEKGARTLPEMVRWQAAVYLGGALRFRGQGRWRDLSYAELGTVTGEIARGLTALGVRKGERVSILAGTRPEWTLVDLGALSAGAGVVPIYHSNTSEECRYILEHAGSRAALCEDSTQLAKLEAHKQCPQQEHVVTFDESGPPAISLDELRRRGRGVVATELDRIAATVAPQDVATIVYAWGTTGPPNGCITPQANLIQTARMPERQSKVRDVFGADPQLVLTGADPIAGDRPEFFDACCVLVRDGYGLTETTAAVTLNTPSHVRIGTVGRPLPGVEMSIAADGEILIGGPNVFADSFTDEHATREALTEDGWLHSGDLGSVEEGFLRITGRKKDIIMTSGGESITPSNIETALRAIRWVSEALVFGDNQRYLVAALMLDPQSFPSLAAGAGVEPSVAVIASDERVHTHFAREIDRVNQRFARVEQVKPFTILDREISQATSELTPTQKAKRAVVYSNFKDAIDSLYQ